MFIRFSLVGVSFASIALSVLCPSPARALSYTWSYAMQGGQVLSGTIDDLSEGTNYATSVPPAFVTVTSGTGSYATAEFINQTFSHTSGVMNVASGVPINGGSGGVTAFTYTGMTTWNLNFRSGSSAYTGKAYGVDGFFDMELLNVSLNNTSSAAQSFTPVPAPLPLLGLGAATAFSRKLKQRIALKRKREEVG